MKLKCKKAHEDASNGFLGIGARGPKPIEGLTLGKQYDAFVVNQVEGSGQSISFDNNVYFLIYNDFEMWDYYDLNLFEPI